MPSAVAFQDVFGTSRGVNASQKRAWRKEQCERIELAFSMPAIDAKRLAPLYDILSEKDSGLIFHLRETLAEHTSLHSPDAGLAALLGYAEEELDDAWMPLLLAEAVDYLEREPEWLAARAAISYLKWSFYPHTIISDEKARQYTPLIEAIAKTLKKNTEAEVNKWPFEIIRTLAMLPKTHYHLYLPLRELFFESRENMTEEKLERYIRSGEALHPTDFRNWMKEGMHKSLGTRTA